MTEFAARAVAFMRDANLNADILVIAEHPDGSGRRLELQRAHAFDHQDQQLGMDTYAVMNERGATHYGGVEAWSLRDDLQLELSAPASEALGADGGYRIDLAADGAYDTVAEGLRAILG